MIWYGRPNLLCEVGFKGEKSTIITTFVEGLILVMEIKCESDFAHSLGKAAPAIPPQSIV